MEDQKIIEGLQRLQKVVNDILQTDLKQYAIEHKLALLDSKFKRIDDLLDMGILYIKKVA
jgi:hypothetical protein